MEINNKALYEKRKFKYANCGFAGDDSRGRLSIDFFLLVDGSAIYPSTWMSLFDALLNVNLFISFCPLYKKSMLCSSIRYLNAFYYIMILFVSFIFDY